MRTIEVKQLNYDLTAVAGLALVGDYLKTIKPVLKRVDKALPVRAGKADSDIVRSYVGLLVQGKSDFDATRNYRLDKFYEQSLDIELLASSPTLGQRMDAQAPALPSGKFETNALVCHLAALAMNILRRMGQRGLLGPDAPVRHSAKRRRIKTVMQELIYRAGRLVDSRRKLILGLVANDRAAKVFMQMHLELADAT